MSSTFSELKFELIGTGDQAGNWGQTTNNNIGTAIEQAITGLGNPVFETDADLTIGLTDTVALQTARALVLNVTSTVSLTETRTLTVPTIEKQYIVDNNTSGGQSLLVKTASGLGITVPAATRMHLYVDGVDVIDAVTYFSFLNLGSALPIASGGTGETTRQAALDALAGSVTSGEYLRGNGTDIVMSAIQAGDVPTLNQNTTGTAGNVTGTVAIANGGTGETTRQAALDALAGSVTSGEYLRGNGTDIVMSAIQAGDVPTLNQNTTGTASNVTGTVAIANGGTGETTRQAALDALAGSVTSGEYLRGNGLDVVMSAIQAGDVPTLNQNTTGTAGNVTGTVAIANGGTGETTRQAALDALAGSVTSGEYLRGNGTDIVMSAIQAGDVPTLNQNTTGTAANVTGTVAIANGGTGQTTAAAAITALTGTQVSGQYLRSDGTNAALSAIQAADVPTLNQNTTGTAANVTGTVAVANGGTGATDAAGARTNLVAAQSGANTDITSIALTTGTISTAPSGATDIVNKSYVDTLAASGIHFHEPVRVESPINLNATYNNGTSGVGATLTNAGTQAALVIDGVTVSVADRVLIYTQTTQTQNGIYVVTSVGSGSTNWVLTRSSDADTYVINSAAGLSEGSTVFVQQGSTGAGETYTCNTSGVITFGTTNITFAQISSAQIYSAGTGLSLSGTQFSITNTGTAGTYGSASSVPVLTTNAQGQVTGVTNTAISLPNSATTATSANTANAIVARDASGNFSAGTITAALSGNATTSSSTSGNAATATALQNARTLWGQSFNGTANITGALSSVTTIGMSGQLTNTLAIGTAPMVITSTTRVANLNVATAGTADTLTTARTINGVSFNGSANITVTANTTNTLTRGTYLTGNNFNGSAATTWAVDATTTNTASKVVARDASGNFAAGTITAALSGNATSATTASTAVTATTATNVTVTTSSTSSAFKVPFANTTASTTGNYGLLQDSTATFTYNPSTNTLTAGTISSTVDGTNAIGFRNIPQNSRSAAYTLVLDDAGRHIFHPAADANARTFTIPANSSVAFPIGTVITFVNMSTPSVTIAITTDTLTLSPAGTAGSRTLATNGVATCIKITTTQWLISGTGLT